MNYRRRMKVGAFLGLAAAAIAGSAITHDNITGVALLLYPVGLVVGLVLAHVTAVRKAERDVSDGSTPQDYFKATRRP